MRPKFHSARAYVAFEEAIRKAEPEAFARARACCGADRDEVARRLIQRVVELGLHEFIEACARRLDDGLDPLPDSRLGFSGGGMAIDANGRIRVRPELLVRSLALFAAHWGHALAVHVCAFFKPQQAARGAATLVHGVGLAELTRGGSDREFLEFCRMGPIAPLREARRYVVQALGAIGSANPAQCTYHRVPLFALALENPVGATGFSRFLLEHTRALLAYLRAVARFRAMCIIGRDFAYHASASRLDAQGLIENVIITNSNYSAQPLWMRRHAGRGHSTHMVWYSQNCIPFVYAFDPVRTQLPNHRHLAFDETWAWTEGFADYIRSVGVKAAIHVVGPIMFYLPEPDAGPRREGELRIMVFDVTPVRPEIARRIGLVYNYYSTDNVLGFIGDIVSAARNIEAQLGKKVRVALKHKRTHEPTRDPRYVAAIERLADDEGALELEPPEANVYSLAAAADVVIAVPYSSPVYVAQDAGTAALYYDATGELIPAHEAAADIPFAARSVELEEKLLEILGGCARRPPPAVEPSYPRTA
jgi:hypothetical protein